MTLDSGKLVCIFCLDIFNINEETNFDNHIQEHLKENIDSKTSRWYSSGTSMASNSSSSGNMHMASQQRVKHDSINNNRDSKNYLIIQNFEPKPRKRL